MEWEGYRRQMADWLDRFEQEAGASPEAAGRGAVAVERLARALRAGHTSFAGIILPSEHVAAIAERMLPELEAACSRLRARGRPSPAPPADVPRAPSLRAGGPAALRRLAELLPPPGVPASWRRVA